MLFQDGSGCTKTSSSIIALLGSTCQAVPLLVMVFKSLALLRCKTVSFTTLQLEYTQPGHRVLLQSLLVRLS